MPSWNERYRRGEHVHDEPHPLIVQFASQLRPSRALDVACGPGRHALWLAAHGWQVTAVDSSSVALDILRQRAAQEHLAIDARGADLEQHEFTIDARAYDLIVVCNYLQRDLFPAIRAGTTAGGMVIAVIAMVDDDPQVKPMNPAYLLNPGELRGQFELWKIVWYREGKADGPHGRATAEVVARNETSTGQTNG